MPLGMKWDKGQICHWRVEQRSLKIPQQAPGIAQPGVPHRIRGPPSWPRAKFFKNLGSVYYIRVPHSRFPSRLTRCSEKSGTENNDWCPALPYGFTSDKDLSCSIVTNCIFFFVIYANLAKWKISLKQNCSIHSISLT